MKWLVGSLAAVVLTGAMAVSCEAGHQCGGGAVYGYGYAAPVYSAQVYAAPVVTQSYLYSAPAYSSYPVYGGGYGGWYGGGYGGGGHYSQHHYGYGGYGHHGSHHSYGHHY